MLSLRWPVSHIALALLCNLCSCLVHYPVCHISSIVTEQMLHNCGSKGRVGTVVVIVELHWGIFQVSLKKDSQQSYLER